VWEVADSCSFSGWFVRSHARFGWFPYMVGCKVSWYKADLASLRKLVTTCVCYHLLWISQVVCTICLVGIMCKRICIYKNVDFRLESMYPGE